MKFLCDQMLVRLGRWLRAAGYDTMIIKEALPDRAVLEKALKEKRLLLTRDKHFLEMDDREGLVIHLKGNSVDACARELTERVPVNWTMAPFSRCLACNKALIELEDVLPEEVPEDIFKTHRIFWSCENCEKLFWDGSHTDRMLQTLKSWQK